MLIDMDMVKDEPGMIGDCHFYLLHVQLIVPRHSNMIMFAQLVTDGVWSKVYLYHPDDLRWFLNCDETHHTFSTASKKGGSTTQAWGNSSFPRYGESVVESSRHTTGLYTTNAAGEALPPLYIFDSKSQKEENFTIDVQAVDGLPKVSGCYGGGKLTKFNHSWVSVLGKGSMNTSLWSEFNRKVILTCFPNIASKVSLTLIGFLAVLTK